MRSTYRPLGEAYGDSYRTATRPILQSRSAAVEPDVAETGSLCQPGSTNWLVLRGREQVEPGMRPISRFQPATVYEDVPYDGAVRNVLTASVPAIIVTAPEPSDEYRLHQVQFGSAHLVAGRDELSGGNVMIDPQLMQPESQALLTTTVNKETRLSYTECQVRGAQEHVDDEMGNLSMQTCPLAVSESDYASESDVAAQPVAESLHPKAPDLDSSGHVLTKSCLPEVIDSTTSDASEPWSAPRSQVILAQNEHKDGNHHFLSGTVTPANFTGLDSDMGREASKARRNNLFVQGTASLPIRPSTHRNPRLASGYQPPRQQLLDDSEKQGPTPDPNRPSKHAVSTPSSSKEKRRHLDPNSIAVGDNYNGKSSQLKGGESTASVALSGVSESPFRDEAGTDYTGSNNSQNCCNGGPSSNFESPEASANRQYHDERIESFRFGSGLYDDVNYNMCPRFGQNCVHGEGLLGMSNYFRNTGVNFEESAENGHVLLAPILTPRQAAMPPVPTVSLAQANWEHPSEYGQGQHRSLPLVSPSMGVPHPTFEPGDFLRMCQEEQAKKQLVEAQVQAQQATLKKAEIESQARRLEQAQVQVLALEQQLAKAKQLRQTQQLPQEEQIGQMQQSAAAQQVSVPSPQLFQTSNTLVQETNHADSWPTIYSRQVTQNGSDLQTCTPSQSIGQSTASRLQVLPPRLASQEPWEGDDEFYVNSYMSSYRPFHSTQRPATAMHQEQSSTTTHQQPSVTHPQLSDTAEPWQNSASGIASGEQQHSADYNRPAWGTRSQIGPYGYFEDVMYPHDRDDLD
ncbi:uncharacterized protein SPSK_03088 [Sporothrix schenckii 1099-18]|uniref:Uncharacterized protein n=1 Tax=Sporothrix schenckii 1099-18 TaxID=1397361 RepID=A0A0F2M3G6_SPOSC|nr:uncharacterized protein SPSK_03088 [Sporothrix schenckii 1099-18]KJR82686.1 hypothetical protein SPSK_03088 [Sporothrix schenckii 1099-18]